jgi:hypothetical protein
LHPANFRSPTAYYPPTTPSEPVQQDKSEDSSDSNNKQTTLFPDPDTLEPSHVSPGTNIAQELEQAPIFHDTAEPRTEDEKGKSKEAYLPLNPSPTFALPSVHFINMGSSSKDKEESIRRKELIFGVLSLNPKEDFSPFSSSFAPMKRVLLIGLQTHKHTPQVDEEDSKHITDGGLKGEGPEKYQGDRDKAREFM